MTKRSFINKLYNRPRQAILLYGIWHPREARLEGRLGMNEQMEWKSWSLILYLSMWLKLIAGVYAMLWYAMLVCAVSEIRCEVHDSALDRDGEDER